MTCRCGKPCITDFYAGFPCADCVNRTLEAGLFTVDITGGVGRADAYAREVAELERLYEL